MTTDAKIRLGAASILLLVIAVATASFWTIRNLTRAYNSVDHTNLVLNEIDAIPSFTKDTVSGVRGYVITGNKNYLQTYMAAARQIEPHLKTLHDLTDDNPDQHRRAEELRGLLDHELATQKEIVALREAGGSEAQAVSLLDDGKRTMEIIRGMTAQMKVTETLLLDERIAAAEHHAREVVVSILLMSVLAVLFVAMSYYVAQHDRRAREVSARILKASEERTRLILNSMAEGIYTVDLDGNCTGSNPACLRLLRYEDEHQLLGKNMHELAHHTRPDGAPLPIEECRIVRALKDGRGFHADDEVFWRSDGSNFPAEYWSHPIRRDGRITGAVVTILDITKRKKAEADSRQANEMLANLVHALERSGSEVSRLSQMGSMLQSCLTLEEAYAVISRVAPGLFPEESGAVFTILPSRDSFEAVVTWGDSLVGTKVFAPDDCWALRSGHSHQVSRESMGMACRHVGQAEGVSYLCVPMMAQGEASGILHLQSPASGAASAPEEHFKRSKTQLASTVAEHIALAFANLKLRDALRAQSIRDPLTGLFNRRFMEESLAKELKRAERNSCPVSVIMLDVDHFKRYNDTHGHEAGDAVLREMGGFILTQIRGEDIACRFGGEEFVLLMPDASIEIAAQRAERMRQGVKRIQISAHGQPLDAVSVSLGVAAFPEHGKLPVALLRSADGALYEAKEEGRDRVVVAKAIPEETT
jgi:diguanylate cyclase (GGDEF)-like protein/PAS domain S-box-containing protein